MLPTLLALALAGASPAVPADDDRRSFGYRLSATDIISLLSAQGYSDIDAVELDEGRDEVEARAPDGREVELELDPDSGAILAVDCDDWQAVEEQPAGCGHGWPHGEATAQAVDLPGARPDTRRTVDLKNDQDGRFSTSRWRSCPRNPGARKRKAAARLETPRP